MGYKKLLTVCVPLNNYANSFDESFNNISNVIRHGSE